MNESSPGNTGENTNNSDFRIVSHGSLNPDQKQKGQDSATDEWKGQEQVQNTKQGYLRRLKDAEPDRHIELALTFVIAFFSMVQLIGFIRNNNSTSQQTDQIIEASKFSAYAADRNALAANNFSESARGINHGVSDAVNRLREQAKATQDAADASTSAAQTASRNLDEEIRNRRIDNYVRLPQIKNYELTITEKDSSNYTAQQTWRNIGQTRATKLHIFWIIGRKTFPSPYRVDDRYYWKANVPMTLIENSTSAPDFQTVAKPIMNGAAGTDSPIYLFGWATYDDLFSNKSSRHHQEFCYNLVHFDLSTLKLTSNLCSEHNCTDDECKKD